MNEMYDVNLGRYGRLHREYLREHEPAVYWQLVHEHKLTAHCLDVQQTARERMDYLIPLLAYAAGATEDLKARDPIRWVGLMNTCKAQAEELVLQEVVYR